MDDDVYEQGERGKSLRVYLVNPPLDEPWRTRGDYLADRQAMEGSFRRNAEAHELLKKSYRNNIIALIITFLVMIGTLIMAFVMFQGYLARLEAERDTVSVINSQQVAALDARSSPQ